MTNGRGGWTPVGMPPGATGYYKLMSPIRVGEGDLTNPSIYAVNQGVLTIQRRINGLGWMPRIATDGVFGERTDVAVRFTQAFLGILADGHVGPRTMLALLWPVVQMDSPDFPRTIGGLCQAESGWDPGAVGYLSPDDHGLMQINAIANPTMPIASAFHHRIAFQYANRRIIEAMNTYKDLDIAIASYNSPGEAQTWYRTGAAPSARIRGYVDQIKAWMPPS